MTSRKSAKHYSKKGVRVIDRPWHALVKWQREARLDVMAWHESRDIFAKILLGNNDKRIRQAAERSTEAGMRVMVKAWKMGIDLAQVSAAKLAAAADWSHFRKAEDAPLGFQARMVIAAAAIEEREELEAARTADAAAAETAVKATTELAAPPVANSFIDLSAMLDAIVLKAAGPGVQRIPLAEAEKMPPTRLPGREGNEQEPRPPGADHAAAIAGAPAPGSAEESATSDGDIPPMPEAPQPDLGEIEAIRANLVRNGKPRLDPEAIAVYMLAPSFFAIATGLNPELWQSRVLDSYALRLGVLASRQCGKSLTLARKATAFALCNPASTTLILAPTLRQSSELLLKVSGVCHVAGIKLSSLSQFQAVFADKQPGAFSRIVALPGSNEDSGASARGYAADALIFEEAAFLADPVIMSVLPSIAARPRAQLIGISSAGIIGSYFHSVMTAPGSRWTKIVVPAAQSGRFTAEQLEELKLTLGARYGVEMECKWGSIGDSIYTQDIMDTAFGTNSIDQVSTPETDPDSAYQGWLDLEEIFQAKPFAQQPFSLAA